VRAPARSGGGAGGGRSRGGGAGLPRAKPILLALLAVFAGVFAVAWALAIRAARCDGAGGGAPLPSRFHLAVGFATDFLDTLGIGSFATTTTAYRLGRGI